MTESHSRSSEQREPIQRWRIRYARDAAAAGVGQREEIEQWSRVLGEAFLTIVRSVGRSGAGERPEPGRPRLGFGPALPVGVEATDEPLEFELTERRTLADVRSAVAASLPPGHRLVAVHDVWVRAPSLAALARELEYRLEVEGAPPDRIVDGVAALLHSEHLLRERTRGSRGGAFDLRPLVAALEAVPSQAAGGASATLRFVAGVDPALGVGRPDDLLSALSDFVGTPLVATRVVRTRVGLADD